MVALPPDNITIGWGLILASFLTGAVLGLFFHKSDWWGGYDSLRRRMARLGHIAFAQIGILNILFGLSEFATSGAATAIWAGRCLAAGGVLMPLACFLTAWRPGFRHVFPLPVVALVGGAVLILIGGGA